MHGIFLKMISALSANILITLFEGILGRARHENLAGNQLGKLSLDCDPSAESWVMSR